MSCKSQNGNFNEHTVSSACMCLLYRAIYPVHVVRIKMAAMLQIPRVFPRVSCLGSAKVVQAPVPGQKLAKKVSKSRAIPPYVPGGVNPTGWPLISALDFLIYFSGEEKRDSR